jgi:hypothetical protein
MSTESLLSVVEAALTGKAGAKALQHALSAHHTNFLHCERAASFYTPRVKDATLVQYAKATF